jgi:2'-5' RNA ligase
MQKFSQKYTLIQLLEPMSEGVEYDWKEWPLHVTIADIFAISWDVPTLLEKLSQFVQGRPNATAVVGDDTLFGPERQTRVALLQASPKLLALHIDVVNLLKQGDVVFNHPEFTESGFLPHSTVQAHARLNKGEVVTFDALTLIDMFPHEDPYRRKVIKTIPFVTL